MIWIAKHRFYVHTEEAAKRFGVNVAAEIAESKPAKLPIMFVVDNLDRLLPIMTDVCPECGDKVDLYVDGPFFDHYQVMRIGGDTANGYQPVHRVNCVPVPVDCYW